MPPHATPCHSKQLKGEEEKRRKKNGSREKKKQPVREKPILIRSSELAVLFICLAFARALALAFLVLVRRLVHRAVALQQQQQQRQQASSIRRRPLSRYKYYFLLIFLIVFIIDAVNPAGGENKRRDRRPR